MTHAKAGELLLEAKAQVAHGQWNNWVDHNFRLSKRTAEIYMNLAVESEKRSGTTFSSLGDFVRQTSNPNYNKPHTVRPTPWHEPVKHTLDNPALIERIRQDTQARSDEAKLTRELALKLIEIGYKVLATKLHPDTGGSKEADVLARLASLALQYGCPVQTVGTMLSGVKVEPAGLVTGHPTIHFCSSLPDAIGQHLLSLSQDAPQSPPQQE